MYMQADPLEQTQSRPRHFESGSSCLLPFLHCAEPRTRLPPSFLPLGSATTSKLPSACPAPRSSRPGSSLPRPPPRVGVSAGLGRGDGTAPRSGAPAASRVSLQWVVASGPQAAKRGKEVNSA